MVQYESSFENTIIMTTIYSDDFIDNEVYDNDEDGHEKLPARHHATIK